MTRRKLFCVKCDELQKPIEKMTEVIHNVKREKIAVNVMIPYCSDCGYQLSDLDIEEKHFDIALMEYRHRKKLLLPEEIRAIREKYGLSQRAFSRALGFSEITINRYESGAIQDVTHNGLILLVNEPENMLKIAHQNKENLSMRELKTIDEKKQKLSINNEVKEDIPLHQNILAKLEKFERKLSKLDDFDKKFNMLLHSIKSHNKTSQNKPYDFNFDDYFKPPGYAKDFEEVLFGNN
jgi:putative zinc finger/helix-turn-helix YgiT family protein